MYKFIQTFLVVSSHFSPIVIYINKLGEEKEVKSKYRLIHVLFFIFLLVLPIQVFGHGEDEDGHDVDSAPWLSEKVNSDGETDDHGHGDGDDHSHGETGDHGHGEANDHSHGDAKGHSHGDDDHGHGDDGHSHEYEETGANLPLLGTFAAINGGFILFGAIRKINKRRKSGVK